MPRRTSNRTVTSSATPQAPSVVLHPPETPFDSNVLQLRRQWKWAAFGQFFFTFNALFAMNDVTLVDVENDLVHSTNQVLSRIMQRLLITVTQDRKINADNWQNALRRQYLRRDPDANPIGPMSQTQTFVTESSRASTAPPVRSYAPSEAPLDEEKEDEAEAREPNTDEPAADGPSGESEAPAGDPGSSSDMKVEDQDPVPDTLEETEKQIDWLDLPMLTKLESLHTVVEWQFQNPHRLRQQMKSDDENALWRIEAIGYDAKRNAYWLIGGERLWIQREPPRINLKRKRKPEAATNAKKGGKKAQTQAAKRQRVDPEPSVVESPPPATRSTRHKAKPEASPGSRGARAAKARANQKLDAQAKDLADFQRQMASSSRTRGAHATAATQTPRKPSGIRVSARLRGTVAEDDEWQEVPEEWLTNDEKKGKGKGKDAERESSPTGERRSKTGLESDDDAISDLTELSDEEEDRAEPEPEPKIDLTKEEQQSASMHEEAEDVKSEDVVPPQQAEEQDVDEDLPPPLPADFIEWETICVTLEEWEDIGHRFEKATHYAEKALHKVLSQSIVPEITDALREIEKQKRLEEAVVHRKRSSRIAMKESEKEEERTALKKRAEEEEKMGRARRLEARQQKEEAERLKRENAREQRRKERELREQRIAAAREASSSAEAVVDVDDRVVTSKAPPVGHGTDSITLSAVPVNGSSSGSRTPAESWELDCEICGRRGLNQDDGVPIMCCGVCAKWQHIICHDKQDAIAGRPKRNWDAEEFVCQQCRLRKSRGPSSSSPIGFHPAGVNNTRASVYAPGTQPYYSQSTSYPRNYPNGSYYQDTPPSGRYSYEHQSDLRSSVPLSSPQSYPPQPRSGGGGVTFAHYQPQQGGFSTSRPSYSVQDGTQPQQARYSHSISPHPVPATGVIPYPSSLQAHPMAHASPGHGHEQWQSSPSYSRTNNPYAMNGAPTHYAQGVEPYYNGHASNGLPHLQYSQVRAGTSQPMGQYSGFQHAAPYQQSR